jgi:hypothetical protein
MEHPIDEPPGIGQAGHLLIGALRRIAAGRDECVLLDREFALAFPGDGREVLGTLGVFLRAIALCGRRRLRAGWPGADMLMPDERLVLALIAAAQHDNQPLFDAYLCWLTRAEHRDAVAITAGALAAAFAAHGQWLPVACAKPTPLARDVFGRTRLHPPSQ